MAINPTSSMHMTDLTVFFKKPDESIQRNLKGWIPKCHEYVTKTIAVETVDAQLSSREAGLGG